MRLRVAEAEGLVGYALTLFRSSSRRARLYSLAVGAPWRGRGVARLLLADAAAAATARGCKALDLEVRVDNGAALALYASSGYRLRGERPAYYRDGAAARLLTLDLERTA